MNKNSKELSLLNKVRVCVDGGKCFISQHAKVRMRDRDILDIELFYILRHGYHERSKDTFDRFHKSWNYSVRGKTLDDRSLRIVLCFDREMLVVVTAIEVHNEN